MKYIYIILIYLLFSCQDKMQIVKPTDISNLEYAIDFETSNLNNIEFNFNKLQQGIHHNSLCFNENKSNITINKKIVPEQSLSIVFWFRADFTGRNGTLFNLSKKKLDIPIISSLFVFLNKNRIAVFQGGKDLRKINYVQNNPFSFYFLNLKELNSHEIYFFTYVYSNNTVKIYIDGKLYSEYTILEKPDFFNFITIGSSYNDKEKKYFFKGCIDDFYIYNKELSILEINNLMNYTHVFQYEK